MRTGVQCAEDANTNCEFEGEDLVVLGRSSPARYKHFQPRAPPVDRVTLLLPPPLLATVALPSCITRVCLLEQCSLASHCLLALHTGGGRAS